MMACASTLILSAHAGGYERPFDIVEYKSLGRLSAIITLRPVWNEASADPADYATCDLIKLKVSYHPEPFWRKTWSGRLVTRDTQRHALQTLAEAAGKKQTTNIGMFGSRGLPTLGNECTWKARGLAVLANEGALSSVYAFHDPV